jgi:MFS family permease
MSGQAGPAYRAANGGGSSAASRLLEPHDFGFRSNFYALYVVVVICLVAIIAMIDRSLLNLLIEPIKKDLAISDTQVSLLQGFAFALFYAFIGIPLARMADNTNRVMIIFWGMIVWTAAMGLSGLATSFAMLFMARMLLGVGEATLTPAGYSLLSDYFDKRVLSRVISAFIAAGFLGTGLALVFGGAVYGWIEARGAWELPLVGTLAPWKVALLMTTLPGVFGALLFLSVREPPRHRSTALVSKSATADTPVSLGELFSYMAANWRPLGAIIFGLTAFASVGFGIGSWTPAFLIRTYGMSPADVGFTYGVIYSVSATAGVLAGGWFSDWLLARGYADSNLRVGLYSAIIVLPFVLAFPLLGDQFWSLVLLVPVSFFTALPFGAGTASMPLMVPNRIRAQIVAIYLFTANLLGVSVGPTAVALLTDIVFRDPALVRYSIAFGCSALLLVGIVIIAIGLKPYRLAMQAVLFSAAPAATK